MIEPIEIEVNPGTVNVEVLDSKDIDLSISKREFNIVGDNVYIEKTSSHAPQWLADFVAATVDTKLNATMTDLDVLKDIILDEMSIVENQYTSVVNQLATTEASMVSKVDTLNATVEDTAADIVNIQQTYATLDAASTISASVLQSSLDSGNIKSAITSLSNTFVTPLSAVSNSIEALHSSLLDSDTGLVISNAEGLEALSTYVGTDVAEASYDQSLSAYLVDNDGNVGGATSKVSNLAYVDSLGNIKSKFEYNSDVTIDGATYPSNFGLVTSTNGGIPTSEFWINADKFKMTGGDSSRATIPFSVDTTQTPPLVSFNGRITVNNFQEGSEPISYIGEYPDVASLPATGMVNGNEAFVTASGYYVYDGSQWNLRVGTTFLTVIESTNGDIFRVGLNQNTLLIAHVFSNGKEVTDSFSEASFRWRRLSSDTVGDTLWNINHLTGYKQIEVDIEEVNSRATFFCDIMQN
jgi:hypothetical protein